MNADGNGERQVTRTEDSAVAPTWSPDGTKLAFHTQRRGGIRIVVVNLDGTGLAQITGGSGYNSYIPDWRDPAIRPPATTPTTAAPVPTTVRRR
jgi:Tol biopolymer transport system component